MMSSFSNNSDNNGVFNLLKTSVMKKVDIDYPMIRWQPVLVLLFMLGCEDPLQLGIRGIVLDESDSPIANAIVEIRGPAEKQSQRTDSAGEFFFEDLLRGEYDINNTYRILDWQRVNSFEEFKTKCLTLREGYDTLLKEIREN